MFWIPNQLEGAYVGQDVTLECHSEAFPPSINYWEKEDGHTLVSGEYRLNYIGLEKGGGILCPPYNF